MNPRITRRTEWDGTFTLLLDGEPISERVALPALETQEKFLDALLQVKGLEPTKIRMEGENTVHAEWKENA
jgi:hypothetical protein